MGGSFKPLAKKNQSNRSIWYFTAFSSWAINGRVLKVLLSILIVVLLVSSGCQSKIIVEKSNISQPTITGIPKDLNSPSAFITVAASNATPAEKAQARYICIGASLLSGTIENDTGTLEGNSPQELPIGGLGSPVTAIRIQTGGTFLVKLASGQTARATSGTALLNSGKGGENDLIAGLNTINTGSTSGTIYIMGMSDGTTILNAISTLPATGGTIKLSSGSFDIEKCIIPSVNNTIIEGSGWSTDLIRNGPGLNDPVISVGALTSSSTTGTYPFAGNKVSFCTIRDFK